MKRRIEKIFLKLVKPLVSIIKRRMYTEVLVLGDSHVNVFHSNHFKVEFPHLFFNIVRVGGATVSGLQNPNSKSQSLKIFQKAVKRLKGPMAITLLGEVDTGFVIWYRAQKYNQPVSGFLQQALTNYKNLLIDISAKSEVICVSTPLPTITDDNHWGDVANLRQEVSASQKERTDLSIKFNTSMQKFCERNQISFLALDEDSIGEDGVVKESLLNSNPINHHYDMDKYSQLIITHLKESKNADFFNPDKPSEVDL